MSQCNIEFYIHLEIERGKFYKAISFYFICSYCFSTVSKHSTIFDKSKFLGRNYSFTF